MTMSDSKTFKAGSSGAEGSPYWAWLQVHGYAGESGEGRSPEPQEANPDLLPEDALIRPPSSDSDALAAAKKAIAEGALEMLSAAQREAFTLHVMGNLSEREVAKVMRISRTTVQSYIRRAGRVLRAIIEGTKVPKCRPK